MIQNTAKIDWKFEKNIDSKLFHTLTARLFSIYLTYKWFVFSTDSDAYNRFALRTVFTMAPKVFLLYVIGLWLSTTPWGMRHKKSLYFLLLPSLLMSPSIAGFPFSLMGWASFFVAMWSYLIIYKTKAEVEWIGGHQTYMISR